MGQSNSKSEDILDSTPTSNNLPSSSSSNTPNSNPQSRRRYERKRNLDIDFFRRKRIPVISSTSSVLSFGFGGFGGLSQSTTLDQFQPTKIQSSIVNSKGKILTTRDVNDQQLSQWKKRMDGIGDYDDSQTQDQYVKINQLPSDCHSLETTHLISPGLWHTLFISSEGFLYSCGSNRYGACGFSNDDRIMILNAEPTHPQVFSQQKSKSASHVFTHVAAGKYHSLAISHGEVYCCGLRSMPNVPEMITSWTKISNLNRKDAVGICAGEFFSAVLFADGTVSTWGLVSKSVQLLAGVKDIVEIFSGSDFLVMLDKEGQVFQISKQSTQVVPIHKPAKDVKWIQVACGYDHVLLLDSTGRLFIVGSWKCVDGKSKEYGTKPVELKLPESIQQGDIKMIASCDSTFGFLASGDLYMMGNGDHGLLPMENKKPKDYETFHRIDGLKYVNIDKVFMGGHSVFISCGASVIADIDRMMIQRETCDIKLVSGDREIWAHRCILGARVPMFAEEITKKLTQVSNPSDVLIMDLSDRVSPENLSSIVELIYSNMAVNISDQESFEKLLQHIGLSSQVQVSSNRAIGKKETFELALKKLKDEAENLFADVHFLIDDPQFENDPRAKKNQDGDLIVACHRPILAARSPYFKTLFYGGMMESRLKQIPLSDVRYDPFSRLIEILYTSNFSLITPDVAIELMELGQRFQFDEIVPQAEKVVAQNVNSENIFDLIRLAKMSEADRLLEKCKRYIFENSEELKQNEEFEQLDEEFKQIK